VSPSDITTCAAILHENSEGIAALLSSLEAEGHRRSELVVCVTDGPTSVHLSGCRRCDMRQALLARGLRAHAAALNQPLVLPNGHVVVQRGKTVGVFTLEFANPRKAN
jgi:hypothetical protein